MNIEKNKSDFIALAKTYIHRPGIDKLLEFVEKNDFFTAPASTRFHGCEPGGLCAHSIAVGKQMMAVANLYAPNAYDKETLALVSLFHDVCKCGFYKPGTRNVKNEQTGRWETVPTYTVEDQFPYGHGEKSVLLIMRCGVELSDEEVMAIRWHMGGFDDAVRGGNRSVGDAYERYTLAWLLHVADEAATYIDKI